MGLERAEVPEARAGDIVAITGIEEPRISDTLCDPEHRRGPAAADGGRADRDHDLRGQHLAVRRPGRQVRHQPPDPRAPRARADPQRRAARGGHRQPGQVPRLRTRRAAPRHPASRTCAARATSWPCRARRSSSRRSTARRASRTSSSRVDVEDPAPGRGHGAARRAQGRPAQHGAGRQGPRAPRLHDSRRAA